LKKANAASGYTGYLVSQLHQGQEWAVKADHLKCHSNSKLLYISDHFHSPASIKWDACQTFKLVKYLN